LRIGLLAHDSMRGREAGTPEAQAASAYLAGEVARLGLLPAGEDGTYFQPVPLQRTLTRVQASAATTAGTMELTPEHLRFVSGFAGVPATSRTQGEGPIVYTGYMFDPSPGGPELTPQQLANAVAIVRLGAPPGVDESGVPPRLPVATLLAPNSPASAVLLVAEGDLEEFWDYAGDVGRKGAIALRNDDLVATGPAIYLVAPASVERLIGRSLEGARQPLTDLGSLSYTLDVDVQDVEDRNVVAVVPGGDPARSGEYMTLGAHYDHVGVGAPVDGDSIYNGADDNASGTAALLELAEYLAHLPSGDRPARSTLFVWHAAEEAGLLGSEHFTDNPTVPRQAMVGHINMDMVGRNDPDSLFVIGSRRLSNEFGDWLDELNAQLDQPFILDYTFDAPNHPEMLYCRSDHWNFARYGIPSVMMGSGLHDDYHQPSDHADEIEYEKIRRVVELTAALTERVANRPARPTIDTPPPPLGTPCS
jgi:hypothetical protein